MSLMEKLEMDLKEAMRGRQQVRLDTLRGVKSTVMNEEIKTNKPVDDAAVLEIIGRLVRQRRESIEMFSKGGRQELAQKEQAELEILQAYLPQQMSPAELRELVQRVAKEVGAHGPGDKGKVMGKLMPQVKGKAEGKAVNDVVSEILASLS